MAETQHHVRPLLIGTKAERIAYSTASVAAGLWWIQISGDSADDPSLYVWTGSEWVRLAGSGRTRIGELSDTVTGAGYGRRLFLSGGGSVDGTWDSDNSDPLWLGRYNAANDESELRVNIGDNGAAADGLVIGYTDGVGTWHPLFRMNADGSSSGFGAGAAHNLLSATHSDTTADNPVAGDVIVANSDPAWVRKAKGAAHQLFKMDAGANGPEWDTFDWDEFAGAGGDMAHNHQSAAEGSQFSQLLGDQFVDVGTAADPSQGALIYGRDNGGTGALWERLPVGDYVGQMLTLLDIDPPWGYLPVWTSFDWDVAAAATGSDMVHTHASATEGGQLDWDTCFSDAVHTHQSAAEGGQLDHGAALTGLTDDDHTQYLLATGARTGASAQDQAFTNGVRVLDGLYVGSNTNPTADDITFDGNLISAKNSTTYDVWAFHPLASPLTSASWDGDSFSTVGKTLIDLSSVFGAPAGIKAVLFVLAIRDSASSGADPRIILSPNDTDNSGPVWGCGGQANDTWSRGMFIAGCDSNGDVYYQIYATGANTFDVYLSIWGYWI